MMRLRLLMVLLLALTALGLRATPTPVLAVGLCPGSEQDIVNAISTAGVGGTVSLSCPSATTISFSSAITIANSVSLDASSSPQPITLDGGHTDQGGGVQLFTVYSGATLALSHLTLQHAFGTNFGGGAITNFGTVSIASSTLVGNFASVPGAAIYNQGTLTITNSKLSGNSASPYGGAIYTNGGTVTVTSSTLSGNSASTYGGAIFTNNDTVAITGSTLAGNSASAGGAIYNEVGTTSIGASIIAGNSSGGNCSSFGATVTDRGYNLTDSNGACGLTGSTDLTNTDPQLGPLQANGGPTQSMALASTSPAIDDVPISSGLCSATDQRGVIRPAQRETSCDIGAFESVYTTMILTSSANPSVAHQAVTYTATVSPAPDGGTVEFTDGGYDVSGCASQQIDTSTGKATCQVTYTLPDTRQIAAVYSGDSSNGASKDALTQTVNLNPLGPPQQVADCSFATLQNDLQYGGNYYYAPGQCPNPIVFTGTITVSLRASLTAQGNDIHLESVNADSGPDYRVQLFAVNAGSSFDLTGLTLSHGSATNQAIGGGAIQNFGTVTVTDCTFFENYFPVSTPDNGGGGAIYNTGTLTVTNSTFYNNYGNDIFGGGAIDNSAGTVTISHSTFIHNFNGWNAEGGAISGQGGVVTITNSTFSDNDTGSLGAGLSGGPFVISGTIIAGHGGPTCDGGFMGPTAIVTDNGNNLEDDGGAKCGFSATRHDIVGQDPRLGTLADNSGPTQTLALAAGSPAIDFIPTSSASCPTTDQRGAVRPDDNESFCDIGAYESSLPTTSLSGVSGSGTYGGTVALTATLIAGSTPVNGKPITFTLNGNTVCGGSSQPTCPTTDANGIATLQNVGLAGINAGSYPTAVGAGFAGDSGYSASTGTGGLTVGRADQTITVTGHAPSSAAYNSTFMVGATASSGLGVTYGSSGGCSNSGATFTMTSGTTSCTVTYSQAGNGNYNAATSQSETVTAQKTSQTITFGTLPNKTYGDNPFQLTATASSGLAVNFSGSGNCTVSGTTVTITGAGSCTVTASQPGDANYNAAQNVSQTFSIAKAGTTTTLTSSVNPSIVKQGVTVTVKVTSGAGTPGGTVTINDGATALASGVQLDSTGTASITTTALAAGTHSITASYSGNPNFAGSATSAPVSQQVRYTVKVLSTSALTVVLQLQDYTGANVSSSTRTVTAECVVPYSATPPTTCGSTPVQSISKAFGLVNNYKGLGPAYSYSINPHGLTTGRQYDLLVQTDSDPIWHAVAFTA